MSSVAPPKKCRLLPTPRGALFRSVAFWNGHFTRSGTLQKCSNPNTVAAPSDWGSRREVWRAPHTREAPHLEIDEQAQTLVSKAKIRQQLFLVNWGEEFDGFHFHDDLVLHNHVGAESSIDTDILVDHRNRLLARCTKTSAIQFVSQNCIVNGFEESRTKRGMDTVGSVDNFLGDGIFSHNY